MNAPTINPARFLREEICAGRHTTVTTGLAPGHVQANLVILPTDRAQEFAAFCAANPKPCPLVAQSEPGNPTLPTLGDIDVRRDLPRYRVFRDGIAVSEETDVSALWRNDLVAFALGCSYPFEAALLDAGVPIRHIEQGKKVALTAPRSTPYRPDGCMAGWWCRCATSPCQTQSALSRSPRASRGCTARRSTSAIPRRSASPTSRGPSTAASPTSDPARCRCSGPAELRRRR